MTKIQWNNDLKIGITLIDAQHKQLFHTYTDLRIALKQGLSPSQIDAILAKMQHYVTRHFTIEERYMEDVGYPDLDKQKQAHRYFSETFGSILDEFEKTGLTPQVVKKIQEELGEWLMNHVSELDMAFGRYYNSQQNNAQ